MPSQVLVKVRYKHSTLSGLTPMEKKMSWATMLVHHQQDWLIQTRQLITFYWAVHLGHSIVIWKGNNMRNLSTWITENWWILGWAPFDGASHPFSCTYISTTWRKKLMYPYAHNIMPYSLTASCEQLHTLFIRRTIAAVPLTWLLQKSLKIYAKIFVRV